MLGLIRRKRERLVALVATLRAELVLHLNNLQQLAACVAGRVTDCWRHATGNDVAHHGGHQVGEVRARLDAAFRNRKASRLDALGFKRSRRTLRNMILF